MATFGEGKGPIAVIPHVDNGGRTKEEGVLALKGAVEADVGFMPSSCWTSSSSLPPLLNVRSPLALYLQMASDIECSMASVAIGLRGFAEHRRLAPMALRRMLGRGWGRWHRLGGKRLVEHRRRHPSRW
ncbi:hypothetical protein EDD85DRAFT_792966 [Armillaria nabsnona]|nr:hypothetical protein EDD85DRAFT_792966 [Armillaria nabsnona]